MAKYKWMIALAIFAKLCGTLAELLLPYILEHIIDDVVPLGQLMPVFVWGGAMFAAAVITRALNVAANRLAIRNAHRVSYEIRQSLFEKTINLSGAEFDRFGLPSLISRMTSDSYNVQSAVQQLQSLCVRAPIMLIGGVIVSLLMDVQLAMILVVMLPILIAVILFVSAKGIPLYTAVQQKLDVIVRIMRENITGIRVVKALSKENYEVRRFAGANDEMTRQDIAAATVMAIPGPLMQLCLNIGLTLVVLIGAGRVNSGAIKPGVILAFLTYFNMISMGVMGLSRIFMTLSKASASADRIEAVLESAGEEGLRKEDSDESREDSPEEMPAERKAEHQEAFICFDHVSFSYQGAEDPSGKEGAAKKRSGDKKGAAKSEEADALRRTQNRDSFAGEEREKALEDISFEIRKGESLGIIGPTGCGKTTIISLLMHFYDPDEGRITVGGRDVRSYEKDELRSRFGTVFQNDMIFQDTLRENINFGRDLSEEALQAAAEDAMASEFIGRLKDGMDHPMAIKGANVSGGQKQRILVARALAADPEILVLDDSSSALDYRTDAKMRRAIREHHPDTTVIMIAQRISSVMGLNHILVLDNGKCIGYGSHEELLKTCESYRETYEIQMGDL